MNELLFLSLVPSPKQGQISLFHFKNVTTNYVTDVSFTERMVRRVEGIFFMTQSWSRAQFDSKKLAKMNELLFLSLVPPHNQSQISLFLFRNMATNYVIDVSFNMRMVEGVEGSFFMMQSLFRAQFDKKKFTKRMKFSFQSCFFAKREPNIIIFLSKCGNKLCHRPYVKQKND